MGIDDFSRMGGFRFKESKEGDFINCDPSLRIPPLTDIRALVAASMEVEKSEELNQLPEKKWLLQLIQPGTSLGGARPKAGVMDEQGRLVWQSSRQGMTIMMFHYGNISVIC